MNKKNRNCILLYVCMLLCLITVIFIVVAVTRDNSQVLDDAAPTSPYIQPAELKPYGARADPVNDRRLTADEYPCYQPLLDTYVLGQSGVRNLTGASTSYDFCLEHKVVIDQIGSLDVQVQYLAIEYCRNASVSEYGDRVALNYLYGSLFGYATYSQVGRGMTYEYKPYWFKNPDVVDSPDLNYYRQPSLAHKAAEFCPDAIEVLEKPVGEF